MIHISNEQRRFRLARRHGLVVPFDSVSDAADALVGLHSSDPATVYLQLWARTALTPTDIDASLYERHEVRRVWAMRRTMFVATADVASDYWPSVGKAVAERERLRLNKMVATDGLHDDPARWTEQLSQRTVEVLARLGSASTSELKGVVEGLDVRLTQYQGTRPLGSQPLASRLLMVLAMEGRILRGPPAGTWRSSQYQWVSPDAWRGPALVSRSQSEADTRLIRRWLDAYGPGTMTDLRWWTGLTVRRIAPALEQLDAVEVALDDGIGFVNGSDEGDVDDPGEGVALLPGLDATAMGWKERDWYFGDLVSELFDRNGNAGPTIWVNGRVVGGWAQRQDGSIATELLAAVPTQLRNEIEQRASELADWMGPVGLKSRFPSPLEKRLRAD